MNWALDAYEAARKAGTAAADATWFDLLTAAAFIIFRRNAPSSGRWSRSAWAGGSISTNVVDGEVAVVTNIELEHTEILGETRATIATEKVGDSQAGRDAHHVARRG